MKFLTSLQLLFVGTVLLAVTGCITYFVGDYLLQRANDIPYEGLPYQTATGAYCNIAVIPLTGQLWATQADADAQTQYDSTANSSGEAILASLERAKNDPSIVGIALRVDSPGGSPAGGEMIANALTTLGKPSVAWITGSGDSAAYLASTGATAIIASAFSDVADIGVTGSYLDQSGSNTQSGSKFQQISAGTYKDVGNPNAPLTPAGKAYLQKNVDDEYQTLIKEIAANRHMSPDAVKAFADGRSLTGALAIGTGLIDELGGQTEVQKWFAQKLPHGTDPVLCN